MVKFTHKALHCDAVGRGAEDQSQQEITTHMGPGKRHLTT